MMDYRYYNMMGNGLGWVITLVIIIFLGLGIAFFINSFRHKSNNSYNNGLSILNERYSRGEISSDEYKKIKEEILLDK